MSEVISFRLDPNNPREAQALAVLVRHQERGYSTRQILTDALLKSDQTGIEDELQRQMADILMVMTRLSEQIEHLHRGGGVRTEPQDEKQAMLSDAFVLSVKSVAKPGLSLQG